MNQLSHSELGETNPVAELDKQKPQKSASAFRTISEVSDDMGIPQHVLRFWETKFNQVRPMKRGGGRRYYRPEDVALLKHIHHLLYTEGYTIKGVQKLMKGQGKQQIVTTQVAEQAKPVMEPKVAAAPVAVKTPLSSTQRTLLEIMLEDLKSLRELVAQTQAA